MSPRAAELVAFLRSLRSERDIAGMRRFGITPTGDHLGISVTRLREIGRAHRRDHALALELWATGIHEARGAGSCDRRSAPDYFPADGGLGARV